MIDSKVISTPMETNGNLDSDASRNMVDQKVYRSMIGSLLYVTTSRLDVMFSVCKISSFTKRKSFKVYKENIKVLEAYTQNVGLWYPKGAKFELVGYSDLDYAGCKVERKSTSGTCQLLGRSLVSWSSKK